MRRSCRRVRRTLRTSRHPARPRQVHPQGRIALTFLRCGYASRLPGPSPPVPLSSGSRTLVAVIDLTGDFRLDDSEVFERYYGSRSEVPQLLADFVPCLLELHWECLRGADLVIVPGCLATAGALALHLLVAGDLNASKRGPSSTPGPAPAVQAPPSAMTATGGEAVRGVQTTCHAALRSGVGPLHRPATLMARRISRVRYSTTPGSVTGDPPLDCRLLLVRSRTRWHRLSVRSRRVCERSPRSAVELRTRSVPYSCKSASSPCG